MICSAEDNLTKILFDQATYRGNDPIRLGGYLEWLGNLHAESREREESRLQYPR